MSTPPETRSSLVQFLDSFLQERNIRWILVAGLAILFGSSVMLVTTHWHEAGPVWKYLVFLAYTSLAFVAGRYVCPKLGLDRTGNVLLALVSLLLPVTFVAWRWTWIDAAGSTLLRLPSMALLGANVALAAFAGRETFRRLLRGEQITFLASYLVLALAGAILPGCPQAILLPASLLLWVIFTAGAVKVNRHVFWLAEDMRWPRVFGFFPIMLLAAQFIGLVALCVVPHVSAEWLGSICVLASLTMLLTADAVARVFEQRTGGVVWPWPLSIAVPMVAGLIVGIAGVALAASGFVTAGNGRPLVVAAALAAMISERVGRRTGQSVFIYAMLLLATAAYNFLPSFSIETARLVVTQSAQAVHEQRLPLAFYGLTYLPALATMLAAGAFAKRRGDRLLAEPIEHFVAVLSLLLLALGMTHVKAVFGVGLAITLVFATHERLFRSPVSVAGTILAWLAACAGFVPFVTAVLGFKLPLASYFLAMSGGTAVLFVVGVLHRRETPQKWPLYEIASLFVALALALAFPIFAFFHSELEPTSVEIWGGMLLPTNIPTWAAGLGIASVLCVHSFRWRRAAVSSTAVLFVQTLLELALLENATSLEQFLSLTTLSLCGQWLASRVVRRYPMSNFAQVFNMPLYRILTCELSALLSLIWLPILALTVVDGSPLPGGSMEWLAALAIIGWAFDQAIQFRHSFTALLGLLGVLGLACSAFLNVYGAAYYDWLPVVCGATALAGVPVAELLRAHDHRRRAMDLDAATVSAARVIHRPLVVLMVTLFVVLAVFGMVIYTTPAFVSGILAAAGLTWFAARSTWSSARTAAAALLTWQAVALPLQVLIPGCDSIVDLTRSDLPDVGFAIGALAAIGFAAWQLVRRDRTDNDVAGIIDLQCIGLGVLTIASGMSGALVAHPTIVQIVLSVFGCLVLCVAQLYVASRDQSEPHVWLAVSLVGLALAFLARWHVIVVGSQFTMFVLLAVGVALWLLGRGIADRGKWAIYARPLTLLGYWLPAFNLAAAYYRHVGATNLEWLGSSTLALFLTAGFYFWRGLEERRPLLVLLSAVIANAALLFVWRELHITNPQCYMIPLGSTIVLLAELLCREIPESARNPLRYLGAIVVLVSPTFDMLDGSWLPFLTLMIAAVLVVLIAIGLRVRALIYTGLGFLAADLAGMVVRGCVDHPELLWVTGLLIGTTVLVVGAICELKREKLLARVRYLSAALESWD